MAQRRENLSLLAEAGGYDDAERWWDDVVESRPGGPDPFDALTEAMAQLRESVPPTTTSEGSRKSRTAEPSRRNSGLETTVTPGYCANSGTTMSSQVPGNTVLRMATGSVFAGALFHATCNLLIDTLHRSIG